MARTLIVSDRHNSFFSANNIRVGNQIPTKGDYVKGDIIVNIGESTATEAMWICIESGNPGIWEVVGAGASSNNGGGSNFVSINNTVFVNEPVNEVSLAGLGVGLSNKDKLIVHHNSVHLMEGVDYEISDNKIVKLTEGNWNEESEEAMFAFELFKNVESIDGDKIVVDSKMTCKTNHVVIENACNELEIGIEGFNAGNDMMLVFKNGVNMVEGVDYEVQGGKIVSTGEVWNENGIEDYGMTFVVFKEVVEYDGDAEIKAENIADGSIGMDKLADDVKGVIEDASNIDLSGYASKEEVNSKVAQDEYDTKIAELEGRVEEAFTSANNGKQLIANAIGEPVSAEDTFSAMSSDINSLLSTFKTNMMNNGITVESSDKFKSLIDKIATMVEEGSGKGIQYVEGTIDPAELTSVKSFNYIEGTNVKQGDYKYLDLNYFNNSNMVIIHSIVEFLTDTSEFYMVYLCSNCVCVSKTIDYNTSNGVYFNNITTDIPVVPHNQYSTIHECSYYYVGVGEEDTTLRDSLADILENKGVDVTEEDDMASLISKVDSISGGLDIISATELPATGRENQICVITDNPVDNYVITPTLTINSDKDEIFLYTADASDDKIVLPVLCSNITYYYYFSMVKQGGLKLSSYYYTNNNWAKLTIGDLVLLENGTTYNTDISGGPWTAAGISYYAGTGIILNCPSGSNNQYVRAFTFKNPIDLSAYDIIEITVRTGDAYDPSTLDVMVSNEVIGGTYQYKQHDILIGQASDVYNINKTFTFDISSINDTVYLGFQNIYTNDNDFTITKIILY